jgi:DNA-binding CsgD family transcriptional regulator
LFGAGRRPTSQDLHQRPKLLGRRAECGFLDLLLTDALAGRSRVAVLRGEAGVGKSALLGYVSGCVDGWHVAKTVGVESEMELAYGALQVLSAPMLDQLERLPIPQRDALATAFGLSAGPAPDRFLVGLATLTLFAEIAEQQPLLIMIDDAHWLDHASAQIVGFVARRLFAERVAIVCAARTGIGEDVLAGLPELPIRGLDASEARALLLSNVYGPLDAAVCDQIIAESHGNPLALLELPRTWSTAELAGGFGLVESHPVVSRIEQSYARRLCLLPADTRLLVLAAAADPLGEPVLLQIAAEILGLDMAAADAAVDAGLLEIGLRVEFAHPIVRSAAYRTAQAADRHRVHRALAQATDSEIDPDRRAWHRAHASPGPDEDVADELERAASRAQARGGLGAAATFLERAAMLTPHGGLRARRALAAAHAKRLAGMPAVASTLLKTAARGPLSEFEKASAQRLSGQIALDQSRGNDAAGILLEAARTLEPFDPALARETHLDALSAATVAGRFSDGMVAAVARAARLAPPADASPHATDLLLEGLAVQVTEGFTRGAPMLKQALATFRDDYDRGTLELRWQWIATRTAVALFDDEALELLNTQFVRAAREVGALGVLPNMLNHLAVLRILQGELSEASTLLDEADGIAAACGSPRGLVGRAWLAACQGDEHEFPLIHEDLEREATARADDASLTAGAWVLAVFHNSHGRYEAALAAAQKTRESDELGVTAWVLTELIEAAARCGEREEAAEAFGRFFERTQAAGTELALGLEAASRALLSKGATAEQAHREAIERLNTTRMRNHTGRARLLYGEWLRREGRRGDAREQLRRAHDMFDSMGMQAFAQRARRELVAVGDKARKRSAETRDQLTPQEEQIARLARDGLSNPEIAAQLFLSARTVEWHLGKVFAKLGIDSRKGLRRALPRSEREPTLA